MKELFARVARNLASVARNKQQENFMRNRMNMDSLKNAVGTVFLLATAFFVCSTFISMRSVFADPIVQNNTNVTRSGRQSPRANATTSKRTISRSTATRPTAVQQATDATSEKTTVSRGVASRAKAPSRGVTTTSRANAPQRNVASRAKNVNAQKTNNRAVRARTASNQSRVSLTGSALPVTRSGTTTSYSYLSSRLYSGTYADIIDSATGLISADAYSNCLSSYYTCMDEICTARSDTKGRCSCAGRATNFLAAEEALESANEELIKLSGQLSLLIATKGKGDDLAYAFSLTDAEKVMNCVSWKETVAKYGVGSEQAIDWCSAHSIFASDGGKVSSCGQPDYCSSNKNNFGFDISQIDGSSSDILAQLKAWADAKDLAKQYTADDTENLLAKYTSHSSYVNKLSGITTDVDEETASLDSLANKWGYKLFEYAHNNVCGRVLDSCFNGIYESCGNPGTVTDSDGKTHSKCATSATTNCPFNYNSYISVDGATGDVLLNERGSTSASLANSASCFGYTTSSSTSSTRVSSTSSSTDPYASIRGPVADARRSIMQKYLLDANSACDVYGAALKQTAQNINYQKIAAEQALQQKRLEFKQEEENTVFSTAVAAVDNFNECISEIWDCYEEYDDEEGWTTARVKAYCTQVAQVPHCYETMICSPLQSPLVAVVDKEDKSKCDYTNDYATNTCRNVVTISEILYGTGATDEDVAGVGTPLIFGSLYDSKAVREKCLRDILETSEEGDGLRDWKKTPKVQETTGN